MIEPLEKPFKAVSFGGFKHSTPFEYLFVFLDLNKTVAVTFLEVTIIHTTKNIFGQDTAYLP